MDWDAYDTCFLAASVKRWVAKKVTELLGEEEPSLVEFVVEHTDKHAGAAELTAELTPVLDAEAESFVVKLWRMVIYETLKARSLMK